MLPSHAPLLIVPIRDRRRRRRILTIRNIAISMLSVAVVIAAISLYNGARHRPQGEYSHLLGAQATLPNGATPRKDDIITEGPPVYQGPSPILAAPAAQEQKH